MFSLNEKLRSKYFVGELDLCQLLWEDNSLYRSSSGVEMNVLVPMREGVRVISDLSKSDRALLIEETAAAELAMKKAFSATHVNSAAIGNICPQLHIHVIARGEGDSAWPDTVWGREAKAYANNTKLEEAVVAFKKALKEVHR